MDSEVPALRGCPLCSSSRRSQVHRVEGYRLVRCLDCGLIYVSPRPTAEELTQFYNTSYTVLLEIHRRRAERTAIDLLFRVQGLGYSGKLLEIGCSYGYFLAEARRHGWETSGVELSRDAAEHAQRVLGLAVTCGGLEKTAFLGQQEFDVVVALHLLEHLADPAEQLRLIGGCLRPQGLLVLTMPNIQSLQYRLLGGAWGWVNPPAHLNYFSPVSILRLLERCDFTPISLHTQRGDSPGLPVGLAWDFLRLMTTPIRRIIKRRRADTALEGKPWRLSETPFSRKTHRVLRWLCAPIDTASWPVRHMAYRWCLGPEMVVLARKGTP